MNTTVDKPEAGKTQQSALIPEVEEKASTRKCSFEEWCDKLQRFSIRVAVYASLGTVAVSLGCGLIYLFALWQQAE